MVALVASVAVVVPGAIVASAETGEHHEAEVVDRETLADLDAAHPMVRVDFMSAAAEQCLVWDAATIDLMPVWHAISELQGEPIDEVTESQSSSPMMVLRTAEAPSMPQPRPAIDLGRVPFDARDGVVGCDGLTPIDGWVEAIGAEGEWSASQAGESDASGQARVNAMRIRWASETGAEEVAVLTGFGVADPVSTTLALGEAGWAHRGRFVEPEGEGDEREVVLYLDEIQTLRLWVTPLAEQEGSGGETAGRSVGPPPVLIGWPIADGEADEPAAQRVDSEANAAEDLEGAEPLPIETETAASPVAPVIVDSPESPEGDAGEGQDPGNDIQSPEGTDSPETGAPVHQQAPVPIDSANTADVGEVADPILLQVPEPTDDSGAVEVAPVTEASDGEVPAAPTESEIVDPVVTEPLAIEPVVAESAIEEPEFTLLPDPVVETLDVPLVERTDDAVAVAPAPLPAVPEPTTAFTMLGASRSSDTPNPFATDAESPATEPGVDVGGSELVAGASPEPIQGAAPVPADQAETQPPVTDAGVLEGEAGLAVESAPAQLPHTGSGTQNLALSGVGLVLLGVGLQRGAGRGSNRRSPAV